MNTKTANHSILRGVLRALSFSLLLFSTFGAPALHAVTYTKQNARVVRLQTDPVYDAAGNVTAVKIDSFLVQRLVNDTDSTDVRGKQEQFQVTFDLLDSALAATTVTAATKTVTYPQLAALLRQACLDRANAQGISMNLPPLHFSLEDALADFDFRSLDQHYSAAPPIGMPVHVF